MAPQVARLLSGKHKPTFLPHVDGGDYVVVVNAAGAVLTGSKLQTKLYRWHTQYPGGLRSLTAAQLQARAPARLIEAAVHGMLPRGALRAGRMARLRIVPGADHGHERQVRASAAYAPAFLRTTAPRPFSPPPKAASGALVTDVFPGVRARAELEALAAAQLRPTPPAQALAELDAELARLAKAKADQQVASRRLA